MSGCRKQPERIAACDHLLLFGVDAGHFLHLEKPDEVSKAIREFPSE